MRTASMQFAWLEPEEARAYLERASAMAENYGDRVAMERRCAPLSRSDVARIDEARRWNAALAAGDELARARILDAVSSRLALEGGTDPRLTRLAQLHATTGKRRTA